MLQRCSSNSTSFSILFPSMEEANYYSSSTSSVDCTLSLGTPSTRHSGSPISCNPSFCWDIITQPKTKQATTPTTAASTGISSSNLGGDPLLLARRCANCDTTSTPLWRNGPRGPKSLCNACGIRYKKEERRVAASTASQAAANLNESLGYNTSYQRQQQQYPWSASWCQNDEDQVPCLSWRLNVVPPQFPVTDRPSLFQYQ